MCHDMSPNSVTPWNTPVAELKRHSIDDVDSQSPPHYDPREDT